MDSGHVSGRPLTLRVGCFKKPGVPKNMSEGKSKSPRPQNKTRHHGTHRKKQSTEMEPQTEFKDDLKAFKEHVKMFKALAVGKAPKGDHRDYKYRDGAPVKGQDGKLWRSIRVRHENSRGDEHRERVWVPTF